MHRHKSSTRDSVRRFRTDAVPAVRLAGDLEILQRQRALLHPALFLKVRTLALSRSVDREP